MGEAKKLFTPHARMHLSILCIANGRIKWVIRRLVLLVGMKLKIFGIKSLMMIGVHFTSSLEVTERGSSRVLCDVYCILPGTESGFQEGFFNDHTH